MVDEQDSRAASIGKKRSRNVPGSIAGVQPKPQRKPHKRGRKRRKLDIQEERETSEPGEIAYFTEDNSDENLAERQSNEEGSDEFDSDLDVNIITDEEESARSLHMLGLDGADDRSEYSMGSRQPARPPAEPVQVIDLDPDPEPKQALMKKPQSQASMTTTASHGRNGSLNAQSTSKDRLMRLEDLNADERHLQKLYWSLSDPTALVRCPVCSVQGHTYDACPSRKCTHCGVLDRHFSSACPNNQKCSRCGARGHDIAKCPSKLARSATAGDTYTPCDICNGEDHGEDKCAWIWRTFKPEEATPITSNQVLRVCYECGKQGHWGDDCPTKLKGKRSYNDTFSAKYVARLKNTIPGNHASGVAASEKRPEPPGIHIRGRAAARTHQRNGALDSNVETDSESVTFIGKKIKTKMASKAPAIHIQSGTRGGGVSLGQCIKRGYEEGRNHNDGAGYRGEGSDQFERGYLKRGGKSPLDNGRGYRDRPGEGARFRDETGHGGSGYESSGYQGSGGYQGRGGYRGGNGGVMPGSYHAVPPPMQQQQQSRGPQNGGGPAGGKKGRRGQG